MRFSKQLSLSTVESFLFSLFILLLPTQLGKHFWPEFSIINGIRVDYLSPTLYVTDIILILLFLVWLINATFSARNKKIKHTFRRTPSVKSFVIFGAALVYFVGNIVLSGSTLSGMYQLGKLLECTFLAYYAATNIPSNISFERLTYLLAFGVFGESILAIAQYANQGSIGGLLYFLGERSFTANTPGIANASINGELIMRAYGTFPHPNVLAGFLTVCMTLIFFFLYHSTKKQNKALAGLSVLLGTIALLLTLSRTAIFVWLIFLGAVLYLQILSVRKKATSQKRVVLALSFIGILVSITLFWETLAPRFLQTTFTEEAITQREYLNNAAWTMFTRNPILGAGLGNFLTALSEIRPPLSLGLYLQPVHNIFMLVLAETGIAGLGFFLGILIAAFRRMLAKIRQHSPVSRTNLALMIALVMIATLGLFDHYWLTLQQGQLLFSLILGLCFHRVSTSFPLGKAKNTQM